MIKTFFLTLFNSSFPCTFFSACGFLKQNCGFICWWVHGFYRIDAYHQQYVYNQEDQIDGPMIVSFLVPAVIIYTKTDNI